MGAPDNSLHLVRKYARIFVRGHYLFREANSLPIAKLKKNCELRRTDKVQGQKSENIFKPNGGYCVYHPSNIFRNTRIGEYHSDIPQFELAHIQSHDEFRPVACERKYLMDLRL